MEQSLMELFSDPNTIGTLSTGQKLIGGLITTGMGMGITFIILLLIWGCIAIMTRIFDSAEKKEKAALDAALKTPAPAMAAGSALPAAEADGIQPEIVAVIAAAIAASRAPERRDNFVVRKISRISGDVPAWGSAGLTDSIESRRF